ncbi:MAG: site-2 protease family protein [Candidatus Spechtbacterales bacterium]
MILTILLFVFILGLVVLTHEFGHFYVAKKSGMRVDEFGFGFPPKLFSIKRGETTYSFNLFPIGGFVKIYGEDGAERNEPRSFSGSPMWRRMAVVVAGVVMNFFVAYLFFSAVHMVGAPTMLEEDDISTANIKDSFVQIIAVVPDSPAEEAGIQMGDRIKELSVEDVTTTTERVQNVRDFIGEYKGETILFTVERGGDLVELSVDSRDEFPEDEGPTGIALVDVGIVQHPPHLALVEGAKTTYNLTAMSVVVFGQTIQGAIVEREVPEGVAGPLGIAVITGTVRDMGFVYILHFIALISMSLGLINIVPFPALDGGRFAFLVVEAIKGSPVDKKFENYAHMVGFALLILLIILITYHDITRYL